MTAGRCLVTVVGTRNQVDVSLPASAPIADYADALAGLCGEPPGDEALPPAWSPAIAAGREERGRWHRCCWAYGGLFGALFTGTRGG